VRQKGQRKIVLTPIKLLRPFDWNTLIEGAAFTFQASARATAGIVCDACM